MKVTLMNKNIPVAELEMQAESGRIKKIVRELQPEYLPLFVLYQRDREAALQDWLKFRCIPETREGLAELLRQANVENTALLSIRNLGLNLTDQYWFKLESMELTWEAVNLFQNDFLSQGSLTSEQKDSVDYSPDASSNGELPKRWVIKDTERYLLKAGTPPYFQQPYNECVAAKLLDALGLPHVAYTLEKAGEQAYSCCKTFIDETTEYVPALYIKACRKRLNHESEYQHFLKCMEKLEIPCTQKELDRMLAFDFIIANNDRHYGNFGFIRDVETLEFRGFAPLFDHGNSLWYQSLTAQIKVFGQASKPFSEVHEKQIQNLASVGLELARLTEDSVWECCNGVFAENPYMDAARTESIVAGILAHREYLERNSR